MTPPIDIKTGSHIVPGNHPLQWFFEQKPSQDAFASKKHAVFVLHGADTEPVVHKQTT